ncbi:MAG: COX15/CtaA family protein [Sutterellaceae bacterium]|nr:COX15/CtaA family protein [Burkholderiaceae bacterium]MDW8429431.1 COX15/CtaA family protein [Sutterellaceae bacterium]
MPLETLLLLALKGAALAALPLLYVWRSRAPDKFRQLAWVTAFLTLDLIMFGAFTRLTDSGLGCPDWPGCYGHSNPLSAGEQIRAAETALPTGPVTMTKAWIEMLHRYFAMAVGFLIIVLMGMAWWRWWRDRSRSPLFATAIFGVVCLQGAFGAWTVTMKLQPAVVTAHLLGGLTLLSMLVWLALREDARPAAQSAAELRLPAVIAAVVLVMQITLGGWVSTNYAVMACPDFPLCHGRLIPPDMDFRHGFTIWRDLGMTGGADPTPVPFAALVAIHWTHRTFAYLATAVLGWLAWRAARIETTRPLGWALALLLVLQYLTGLSNVVLQWPLALAVLHNGGAALLVATLTALAYRAFQAGRLRQGGVRVRQLATHGTG